MIKKGAVVIGLVTLLALTTGVAGAQALGEVSPAGEESFADIAACSADSERLLVATVVDESGSLTQTDPDNQRVDAVLAALDSLERLGNTTDLTVEANLAVFGSAYTELVAWSPLEGSHAQELRDTINDELPSRNSAHFTDYRAALSGAQNSLEEARQAGEGESSACKIMLWLSDGRLDVDDVDGNQPVTHEAREEICSPGGLIDGVRADGVAVIALGLLTDDAERLDRERLQAIAEGSGGAETCGTTPVSGTNGAFLHADDASALDRIFAQTVALIEGASGARSFSCPDECVDGRLDIPVDDGVASFRLVLQSAVGAPSPELLTPSGDIVVLDPDGDLEGSISVATSGTLTTIDVRDISDDTGVWTLVSDPEATTIVDLYYFWGIRLVAEALDGLVIGEPSELRVTAVDRQNAPLNLDALSSAEFTATIDDEPVTFVQGQEQGSWTTTVEVADRSAVHLKGEATATTTPSDIKFGPVALDTTLEATWPPSFPSVAPAVIDLGRLPGETAASSVVTVTGADRGPTRVCFSPAELAAPDRAGDVVLVAAEECVDVPAGEEVEVEVNFSAESAADGRITGTLPVGRYEVDADEAEWVDIPVEGTMVRPVDEATRWGLAGLFVLLALAIAWAVASGTRRIFAQFNVSPFARYAEVPVIISSSGVSRPDGRPDLASADQLRVPVDQGRRTSMQVGQAVYSMRYPLNPLAEARGLVTGSRGQVPITDVKATAKDPATRYVEVPGTSGFVVITEKPDDSTPKDSIRGVLIVLVDPGRSDASPAELLSTRVAELARVQWGAEVERARLAWQRVQAAATRRAESGLRRKSSRPESTTSAPDTGPPARRGSTGAGEALEQSDLPPPRRGRGTGLGSTANPAENPPARRGSSATGARTNAPDAPPPRRSSLGPTPPPRRRSQGAPGPSDRRTRSGPDDASPGAPPRRR